LREARRVLTPGGRLAAYTPGPGLRGSPAAPEPLASHCYFHTADELRNLALAAGFASARVDDHEGAQLLSADA
jgi:hypothetical protein